MSTLKVRIAQAVPISLYLSTFQRSVGPHMVALCLHRVAHERRSTEPYPANTFIESQLVELIELLYEILGQDQLVITFDDGYPDAVQFVTQYAKQFPSARFMLFVCPQKITQQAGFRWDLVEYENQPIANLRNIIKQQDIAVENSRADLHKVYRDPRFTLSTIEALKAVAHLPNVELGNHSNCHFNFAKLPDTAWRTEVAASFAEFERLFGPAGHFAFPFGTPYSQFTLEQAQHIRDSYGVKVWSTGRGINPLDDEPLFYNRYALPGDLPLKLQLLIMCRNTQLPITQLDKALAS